MPGREVHIREQELTGIGRRFDLDLEHDQTLMVIARRDGSRDIAVRDRGADEVRGSVHLDREQAVAVGSLLLGARFSEDTDADTRDSTMDVTIVELSPGSPAIGKRPADISMPGGTDAAVVAVARDDTPQLLEDDRSRPCEVGDRLVVAARGDRLEDVVRYLAG